MFKLFKFNEIDYRLFYVGVGFITAFIGGVLGSILTLILSAVLPLDMQNRATFSTITCTELNVVDAGRKRMVSVGTNEHGGVVHISGIGEEVKSRASMYVDTLGGVVRLVDKDGDIHAFEDGKIQSFR